ncbi:MAG: ABC transporter ATP-binding protein/permease [Puniceicoccales bacterium]|jgi:subfamily B ATP-binding cassette protein MsbA|nr:ABC transporter ATP-binding protein/permease [Puniceicoccales bacterium]
MNRFRPYRKFLRPALPHFLGALAFGLVYGVASGFGLPFLTKKVLPVVFGADGKRGDLVLLRDWGGIVDWPPLVVPAAYVLLFAVALLPAAFAVRSLSHFFNVYLLNYAGVRVLEGVRVAVFSRLQELQISFFKKHNSGDLISRITGDTNHVKTVVVDISNDLLIQPCTLLGATGYVVWECLRTPGMARFLLALLIVPAVILPVRHFGKKLAKRTGEMLAHAGRLSAMLTENLQSPREIRSYNLEGRERSRFGEQVRQLFRAQLKIVKYEKMLPPLIEFLSAGSIAFAIYQAAGAGVTLDTALGIIAALFFCYEPLKRLGNVHNKVRSASAAINRLEEILAAPVTISDPPQPAAMPRVRGEITFENVSFSYGAEPVLLDISLRIRAGETVALVGPSGAGKSTFANLVPRFYDPTAGVVRLDDADLRELRLADLRGAVALVSQDPVLFDDSLYNNILLGRPDATRADVLRAAAQAGASDFIEAMPQGWDTPAGERGGKLSGGQRQRIAIARAFLKNAPVLILDEATSALDAATEAAVQQAFEQLAAGKTTFVIAHRFSTIRFATRILVFDKGRIVGDGSHSALMETCPLYRDLCLRQSAS